MPGRPFSWFTCAGLDGALKGTRGSVIDKTWDSERKDVKDEEFLAKFSIVFEYQELFGGSTFFSESTTSEIWNPRKNCGEFDGICGRCSVSLTVYVFFLTCTYYVALCINVCWLHIPIFTGATSVRSFPVFNFSLLFLGITHPVCGIHLPLDRRKASVVSWPSGHGWTRILWQSFSGVKMMVLHISCACFLSKKQDTFMTYTNSFMFTEIEMNYSPCVSHLISIPIGTHWGITGTSPVFFPVAMLS